MMTTCHSNEHGATDLRVGSTDVINIKYIAANELNSLISLVNHELAASSDKSYPNIKHHESTSYYYYY